jgi:dihydroxyacid dehydratase/phosphogluconate dehydratase
MEEFFYAGGLPAILWKLAQKGQLDEGALTVNGKTMGENVKGAPNWDKEVIRDDEKALVDSGGIAVLRGNLCPDGAVLKPSAASPHLMKHRGRAVVFETIEHYYERINDPDLDIDETSVMVLKNCGPRGYPGMPETGNMGLPPKLLARGIEDMVRISDARMSGTAYGTVVLHVCPEAALGGPLALVEEGDWIELDVDARRLHLDVDETELARRRAAWKAPAPAMKGGYQSLFVEHVMQADKGADFDFLVGCRGHAVPRESH